MVASAPLTAFADGVWLGSQPVSIVGTKLTATMTVLRLPNGGLLLHSPIKLTPELRAAVEALGAVEHLYAPNVFHHLFLGEWSAAYPGARVHAPRELTKKRPDLRVDRVHGDAADAGFDGALEELAIDGFRLHEHALLYRPARTLVVADLVHNVGQPATAWSKLYTQMMGFYDRVALSRMLRWTAFSDKSAARRSVDQLLSRPFERLVVGHGTPLDADARAALERAYDWLVPAR